MDFWAQQSNPGSIEFNVDYDAESRQLHQADERRDAERAELRDEEASGVVHDHYVRPSLWRRFKQFWSYRVR